MDLCKGHAGLVEDVHDIYDYIDSLLCDAPRERPFKEMVKYMSWRMGGLPLDYLEAICQNYSTLEALLAVIKEEEMPDASSPLGQALREIKSFFSQDYYIE